MHYYANVENGVVIEIIAPMEGSDGKEIPIDQRFAPGTFQLLVDVTDVDPRPDQWWTYDGASFHPPAPVVEID